MIVEPTVLVLGAGASQPYGYPVGNDLRKGIIRNLKENEQGYNCLRSVGFSSADIINFRNDLKGSKTYNMDDFLQYREELTDIGKYAIAYLISICESKKVLFNTSEKTDWYRYLYNQLICEFEYFDVNEIKVITFNYDRSLEEYLFNAIKSHYGKSDEKCRSKVDNLDITHVYGKLDFLPWQKPDGNPYGPKSCYGKYLDRSAAGIKTRQEIDMYVLDEVINSFVSAKKIYFLGFGYGKNNLELLQIRDILKFSNRTPKEIYGTAYGLRKNDRLKIREYLPKIDLGDTNQDCLQFLKDYGF